MSSLLQGRIASLSYSSLFPKSIHRLEPAVIRCMQVASEVPPNTRRGNIAPYPDQEEHMSNKFMLDKDREDMKDLLSVSRFKDQLDPFGVQDMVTVKDLLDARVHLGHKAGCWTRYVKPYLYGIRNNIHIFNLNTTLVNLHQALNVTGHIAYQNGIILFVNERPQYEALTQFTARECKEYFVTNWKPGILTNSFKLLKTMRTPDLVVFLSVPRSKTAIKEVLTCGLPMVGIVDSNCNPNFMLYPVPGNDDSPNAVQLYCDLFCEVILRAKMLRKRDERETLKEIEDKRERRKSEQKDKAAALDKELNSIYHDK